MQKSIYLIGSLRQPDKVQAVAKVFRQDGWDVFDDWLAAGPEADDYWQKYSNNKGQNVREALKDHAAQHVFHYDKKHLDRCSFALLVLPAGKSGHLELGYFLGRGKPGFILLDGEPERFDVMYNFADAVFTSLDEAASSIRRRFDLMTKQSIGLHAASLTYHRSWTNHDG